MRREEDRKAAKKFLRLHHKALLSQEALRRGPTAILSDPLDSWLLELPLLPPSSDVRVNPLPFFPCARRLSETLFRAVCSNSSTRSSFSSSSTAASSGHLMSALHVPP